MAYAPKISSGIDVVEETWGGLYQGASYLVFGRAASGRGLLPLSVARAGAEDGEREIYVTSDSFEELAARARRVRFNLKTYVEAGLLEIIQIPSFADGADSRDGLLADALATLVSEVEDKRPQRVVIDTFMPFIGFRSFGRFRTSFISMLERIDAADATLILVMAEPANDESEKVIEFMRSQTTAAIRTEPVDRRSGTSIHKLSLMPSIGHAGQAAVKFWHVEDVEPEPVPERGRSRRFRFSEEFEDEQVEPSLSATRWDGPSEVDVSPADQASGEVNGASREKRGEPNYLITPFKLGRHEGGSRMKTQAAEAGRSGPSEQVSSSGDPIRIQSIPLGRQRERVEKEASDRPLTATTGPGYAYGRHKGSFGKGRPLSWPPSEVEEEPIDEAEEAISHTDRESFRARLQQRFLRSSVNDVPFLLIAMRMDRREQISSRPFDFEFILDLVNELLREQDDVYVDLERERLIVMLADTEAEGSRRFFAELRRRLREEAPHQADYLLQSVSAIVVPNGRPFQNAEEFLSYALSEG